MPTSEFQTALTERIEFAVFVAYEGWVRASGYASANPYDVLARVLPGLPESLQAAAAAHGGWGAFEPIGDIPADAARQLIGELASQVVSARIAALAPHAPDANLLTQVVADAVGRAVTVFVEDPESWRLALNPGEHGQVAALGEHPGGQPDGQPGTDTAPADAPPLPFSPADEGGDYGAPGSRVVQTLERVQHGAEASARPDLSQFFSLGDVWWVKTSGTLPSPNAMLAVLGTLMINAGSAGTLKSLLLDDIAAGPPGDRGPGDGGLAVPDPLLPPPPGHDANGGPADGHGGITDGSDPAGGGWEQFQHVIDRWIELLNKASFYRVDESGEVYHLNPQESAQVVETLVSVLVRRAELNLPLPPLPDEPRPTAHAASEAAAEATPAAIADTPPAAAADPAPVAVVEAAGQPDAALLLGSGTLDLPPADATAAEDPTVLVMTHDQPADPVPEHDAGGDLPDPSLALLPPITHTGQDPWHS